MDFVFNAARGKTGYFADLPGANDAFVIVPLLADGLADDATLQDLDTLADVLGATSESPLGRITLTSGVTRSVDDTADWTNVDIDTDPSWPAAVGDPLGALVICYDPDTTTSTDVERIPLTKHDFIVEPNGTELVIQVSASGFYRSI